MDASVVLNWLIDEDLKPLAVFISTHLEQYVLFVPPIWHLEVRNGVLLAERRGRITAAGADQRLGFIRELTTNTDEFSDLEAAFALARAHGLSFYDATYLELALRLHAPLATLDNALERAASAQGLPALE